MFPSSGKLKLTANQTATRNITHQNRCMSTNTKIFQKKLEKSKLATLNNMEKITRDKNYNQDQGALTKKLLYDGKPQYNVYIYIFIFIYLYI